MKIIASGNSMLPTLIDGRKYKLHKLGKEDIHIGEIVVYKIENVHICNRVIKIVKSAQGSCFYKVKGDNCHKSDPYAVTRNMIIGKVVLWHITQRTIIIYIWKKEVDVHGKEKNRFEKVAWKNEKG